MSENVELRLWVCSQYTCRAEFMVIYGAYPVEEKNGVATSARVTAFCPACQSCSYPLRSLKFNVLYEQLNAEPKRIVRRALSAVEVEDAAGQQITGLAPRTSETHHGPAGEAGD